MKISAKGLKALEMMKDGASFVVRLETNYHGNRQFKHRLFKNDVVVKGFGFQTFHELLASGMIFGDANHYFLKTEQNA